MLRLHTAKIDVDTESSERAPPSRPTGRFSSFLLCVRCALFLVFVTGTYPIVNLRNGRGTLGNVTEPKFSLNTTRRRQSPSFWSVQQRRLGWPGQRRRLSLARLWIVLRHGLVKSHYVLFVYEPIRIEFGCSSALLHLLLRTERSSSSGNHLGSCSSKVLSLRVFCLRWWIIRRARDACSRYAGFSCFIRPNGCLTFLSVPISVPARKFGIFPHSSILRFCEHSCSAGFAVSAQVCDTGGHLLLCSALLTQ